MTTHSGRIRSTTLYRIAAAGGVASALVLLVNTAKRAELIPTTAVTQLVAPLGQIFALALVTGLFFAFRDRFGAFGLVGYLLNAFSLAALIGVEFILNLVFAELEPAAIAEILSGPLAIALPVISVLFLLGTLLFALAMLMARGVPIGALVLYVAGATPVALRAFVPELALQAGLVALAAGIAWLAIWLWLRSARLGDPVAA